MSVSTYTASGSKASVVAKLPKEVFEVAVPNHELIKSAYVAYLANGRLNLAKTKNRGEVSGGGKKPWRQKGTGRARFGSSRVPIWKGGGVAMGPTGNENYTHNMSSNDKRVALRQALTLKAEAGAVVIIEKLDSKGKTKDMHALITKVATPKNVLVVNHETNEQVEKAVRNINFVKLVRARALNVFDVMNASTIVLTKDSVDEISEWLGGKS